MPGSFLDTSALAKHYHVEPGSAEVDRSWADPGNALYISRVGVVEAVSVFAGKVRTGEYSTLPTDTLKRSTSPGYNGVQSCCLCVATAMAGGSGNQMRLAAAQQRSG